MYLNKLFYIFYSLNISGASNTAQLPASAVFCDLEGIITYVKKAYFATTCGFRQNHLKF